MWGLFDIIGSLLTQVDLQWKAALSKPVELHLGMIEGLVFGSGMDGSIFLSVKQRKDAMGLMEVSPFVERVEGIDNALNERAKGDKYAVVTAEAADEDPSADGGFSDTSRLKSESVNEPPPKLAQELSKLQPEPKAVVDQIVADCWNKIETVIQLEVEPESGVTDAVRKRLDNSAIQELRQKPKSSVGQEFYVLMVYDLKAAGEASAHPATRLPPLQGNGSHLKDFVKGALAANTGDFAEDFSPHDLFVIPNAGKDGLL